MKKAVTTESANVMVCLMQDKKIEPMTGGTYLFLAAEGTNEISGKICTCRWILEKIENRVQ